MHNSGNYISSGLANILNTIESAVIITDENFSIKFASIHVFKILEITDLQLTDKSFKDLFDLGFQEDLTDSPNTDLHILTFKSNGKGFTGKLCKEILEGKNVIVIDLKPRSDAGLRIFEEIFDTALEGIFIFDSDGRIIDANPAACKIYQTPKEDFLTLTVHAIFPHNSYQNSQILWDEFVRTGSIEGLYKYKNKSGGYRYIDFRGKPFLQPNYHVAVFNDVTEKKAIEKSYKLSEANLRAIFDNSAQQIILINQDFEIVTFNSLANRYYKEATGKALLPNSNLFDYITAYAQKQLKEALKGNLNSLVFEEIIKGIGGQEICVEHTIAIILGNRARVKGICLTSTDVTFRKKSEVAREEYTANLLQSEKKFRSLAENSPDLIYIIDVSIKKVVYFNRSELLGYPSPYLETSDAWLEIVFPEDVKKVKKHWEAFLKTSRGTNSIEYRLKRKNGDYEWVVNRHTIIERDGKGDALQVLLNITIITEQKKAQELLLESEARLTALVENTNDLIWSIDKDFYFTAMNSALKHLFLVNFKKKVSVGGNLLELFPAAVKDELYRLHMKALEGERISKEFSGFSSLEKVYYEISYNPIYSDESVINGVSVFARDITLRKVAEDNIMRANFELDSFVYRASHDLRAPLRSVLGLVNIIKEEESAEKRNYYFGLIEKSIGKLDFFIADLINFSRNSRLEVNSDKINFKTILSDCIDNLKYMENAAAINIIYNIKDDIEFYSDESRISIIFQNLLSNSFKYINTKATDHYIKIAVSTSKKGAAITVEDNGKGIHKEFHDKIFNMFFRASYDSYGSGLGLYITKQVIEKLKGTITVKSKPLEGTTFKINLYNFLP
ncbi:MAG TPA: PAS domain S-box protein [Cytophagaceae bacterium]